MKNLFFIGFCLYGLASTAQAVEPQVTDKERVLAMLLAGKWVESPYYTKADCTSIWAVQFNCPPAISDCPFADRLGDVDKFEVERTYFNYSGGTSRVVKVTLTPARYWRLVRQVEKVLDDKKPLRTGLAEPLDFYQ